MFDTFAQEVLETEVKQRKPKSGWLKKCRGIAIITEVSETDKDSSIGKAAIFDMTVLTVTPSDPANPNDINVVGERVAKWFKFEDGSPQKRAAVKADFKRQLCSIFGIDPFHMTDEQYRAMGKHAGEGKLVGMLLRYEPRTTDKGLTFHDYYPVVGKNDPEQVKARAEKLARGDGPETFL